MISLVSCVCATIIVWLFKNQVYELGVSLLVLPLHVKVGFFMAGIFWMLLSVSAGAKIPPPPAPGLRTRISGATGIPGFSFVKEAAIGFIPMVFLRIPLWFFLGLLSKSAWYWPLWGLDWVLLLGIWFLLIVREYGYLTVIGRAGNLYTVLRRLIPYR